MNKTLLLLAVAFVLPCFGNTFYVGSDSACFYGFSDTSCALTNSESSLGIDLSGNPILSYTPDAGFNAPEIGGVVDLGTFSVADALAGIEGGHFDVDVTFTEPGGGGKTYSATTLGLVLFGSLGAEITFADPIIQVYTYSGGSFDVSLPSSSILIGASESADLYAVITTVPEPSSLGTVGFSLMFMALAFSRSAFRRRWLWLSRGRALHCRT
jgi:hypothetical protein